MSLQQRLATIQGILLPPTDSNNRNPKRPRLGDNDDKEDGDGNSDNTSFLSLEASEARRKRQRRVAEAMALPGMRLDGASLVQRFAGTTTVTTATDDGNNPEPSTSSIPDTIFKNYVQYLKEQSDLIEQDTAMLDQQRLRTLQKQTRVWKAYVHGLSTISHLGDLRHAPDAIMPNNFG